MSTQLRRIVVIIESENRGWTKMYIATRRIGLKGSSNHNAFVAANRKMSFPLLTTTNVCGERAASEWCDVSGRMSSPRSTYQLVSIKSIDIFQRRGGQFRRKFALHSNRYGNSLLECGVRLWALILVLVIVSDLWVVGDKVMQLGRLYTHARCTPVQQHRPS